MMGTFTTIVGYRPGRYKLALITLLWGITGYGGTTSAPYSSVKVIPIGYRKFHAFTTG